MAITDDRKFIHDLRNSIMVIRNLTQLIESGKIKESDKEQAFSYIKAECDKLLALCQKKD
jgi:hypothetical protein